MSKIAPLVSLSSIFAPTFDLLREQIQRIEAEAKNGDMEGMTRQTGSLLVLVVSMSAALTGETMSTVASKVAEEITDVERTRIN